MKITALRTVVVAAPPHRNWVFVKVETDQPGLYGWGEGTLEWKTRGVVGTVEDMAPIVVGQDPRDITRIVELLTKTAFWPLGVIGLTAVSAIEQALWDIKGKDLGQPVWALLGGKVRDRVRVYTHIGNGKVKIRRHSRDIPSYSELDARTARGRLHRGEDRARPLHALRLRSRGSAAYREAAGGAARGGRRQDGHPARLPRAAELAARRARLHRRLRAGAIRCSSRSRSSPATTSRWRRSREQAGCPIATGERLVTHREFEELCGLRAVTYVQPDLCHCGGFTVGKQIAATAATFGIGVCPHNPMGPIAGVVGLHFGAAVPNFVILEETTGGVPWYDDVVQTPIRRVDGYWELPTAPGLGVEVNEKVAAAHPFQQEEVASLAAVIKRDGTIANW